MTSTRNRSTTQRWIEASERRRLSRRGGKNASGMTRQSPLLSLPPFQPDQKAVGEHDQNRVAVKAAPAPALILVPAQEVFGLFMVLLDPMSSMRILDHPGQGGRAGQVAPEVLDLTLLTSARALPDQPPHMAGAIPIDSPAAYGDELGSQPPRTAFRPADRLPVLQRLTIDQRLSPFKKSGLSP